MKTLALFSTAIFSCFLSGVAIAEIKVKEYRRGTVIEGGTVLKHAGFTHPLDFLPL